MKKTKQATIPTFIFTLALLAVPTTTAHAHGFTADVVDIKRLMTGKYRVFIWYTHLQLGEYRTAHIDYPDKNEAIKAFESLVKGADFFLGDAKSIHFHDQPERPEPF